MRKTLSAAVLVLALCCPVAAGIIHNPEPEPSPASATQEPLAGGDMPNGAADNLTEIALDLLSVLPSLL